VKKIIPTPTYLEATIEGSNYMKNQINCEQPKTNQVYQQWEATVENTHNASKQMEATKRKKRHVRPCKPGTQRSRSDSKQISHIQSWGVTESIPMAPMMVSW